MNLLDKAPNQPTKFRIKNWVEIDDDASGTYNTNIQIKVKTSMFDAYIRVSWRHIRAGAAANNTNEKVIFKNFATVTDYMSKINNTQVDRAQDIDAVMLMYN